MLNGRSTCLRCWPHQLRHAPGNDIEFCFLCESLIFPVCVDAAGYRSFYSEGVDAIQRQQAAWLPTYNMCVHSCLGTSIWLYDGPHTGCAFVLEYYQLVPRGCVWTYKLLVVTVYDETNQGFPRWAMRAAPKGERPNPELRSVELPRLARPKGCFAAY